ncbi:MAG TPA: DJ-1/PfpI family protein [Luteimonas sp.]|nr:DJ-1/PfpI family protein [Luteimonas sp.]
MHWRVVILRAAIALPLLGALGFAAWIALLPPRIEAGRAEPIPDAEHARTLAALAPRGSGRPVVAMIGLNDATETTDYLMTTGVLRRADVADVVMVATAPGAVRLYPALSVMPDATTAQFDARHPGGADYVVVPAMEPTDDPAVLAWVRAQSRKGAIVVGVCVGALTVAEAGLLDGRRATTHWYVRGDLQRRHPAVRYVPDRRIVVDRGVATTTGITASMPMMLTLVEAIAGRAKAAATARGLGVDRWDARHDSAAFRLDRPFVLAVLRNRLAFWRHETLRIALQPGMDEVSLALAADAWSRTYRSRVETYAEQAEVATRGGLRILADRVGARPLASSTVAVGELPPAQVLDRTLGAIADRYGSDTAGIVAMQLEYPGRPAD